MTLLVPQCGLGYNFSCGTQLKQYFPPPSATFSQYTIVSLVTPLTCLWQAQLFNHLRGTLDIGMEQLGVLRRQRPYQNTHTLKKEQWKKNMINIWTSIISMFYYMYITIQVHYCPETSTTIFMYNVMYIGYNSTFLTWKTHALHVVSMWINIILIYYW